MFGKHFALNETTLSVVEEIGRLMPGGFFFYQDDKEGSLLYANHAVVKIFGCDDLDDFKAHTGFTFKGMLHPDDYPGVSETIANHADSEEEHMDYVEYRIIRKDGAIRWIEDYGRHTDSDAYGGIHYVFISDITEKREQMESDIAVRQAVIEALSASYHTVWLINDVEKETFSLYRGDVMGDTAHAAPNRDALAHVKYSQAKEYYIKTTAAPSEQARLEEELELSNIVRELKAEDHFNVTYLRSMKDGSERYFRIEFTKFEMPNGKTGIVCGFKDVDEEIRENQRIRRDLQEAKKAEEEKVRLAEQQSKLITAMASDYRCVYYVTLDTDEGICYRTDNRFENAVGLGEHFCFREVFTNYAKEHVAEQYREGFLAFVDPDNIRKRLADELLITYRYLRIGDGEETYEMLRMAGGRRPKDRDDHMVHAIGVGFTDIDREMRDDLARNQALKDAIKAAEHANRAKTAFLSNMSHEIRTPMNAIIGLDNIALNNPDLPAQTREQLEKISDSAQHLLRIINDILDMSRIESGRMTIKHEEFCFSKTLEQVNTMISGQCRDKGLDYDCRIRGDIDDYYLGDDMKLRQVMINILSNAVKFTPSGGKVTFSIEEAARYEGKSTLRLVISDTGIGMSREFLPKLFDAFSQEDSSTTNRYGSTGLGMPITKSIVELMNGNITVESEKGKGTTFTVVITLDKADIKDTEDRQEELYPHELTVLVIDDDEVACEHAKLVLEHVGVRCDVAGSGKEGLDMVRMCHARREPYHLILVDWKMPEMDGIETTRQIREIVGHESAIIILTSYNWDEVENEARNAGVDTFVTKPLFAANVMEQFREAFRKKNEQAGRKIVSLEGRRVLLAEDVDVNAEIMMMVLSLRDLEVDLAENGAIAVSKFQEHEAGYYDVILMDMRMPVMDGLEATKIIRGLDREDAKKIPIIALTANAFDEDVQRSMQAGLNAHLTKPVEPEMLFDTLESLIE